MIGFFYLRYRELKGHAAQPVDNRARGVKGGETNAEVGEKVVN